MKDARIARTTDGQHCAMVVVIAGRSLLRPWKIEKAVPAFT
jgi:hypothetical protein